MIGLFGLRSQLYCIGSSKLEAIRRLDSLTRSHPLCFVSYFLFSHFQFDLPVSNNGARTRIIMYVRCQNQCNDRIFSAFDRSFIGSSNNNTYKYIKMLTHSATSLSFLPISILCISTGIKKKFQNRNVQ